MEVKDFLHMKHGDGDLSYSQNQATFTRSTLSCMTKPLVEDAVKSLLDKNQHLEHFVMADLGCATGSASIDLVSTIIDLLVAEDRKPKMEMLVYLNDLPSNDFNSLFQHLSQLKDRCEAQSADRLKLLFAGVPGSFHGRLFPPTSLHLLHSGYSAHWLSQAPPELYVGEGSPLNKGRVYISDTSPRRVAEAYKSQFLKDFTAFLSCRSQELIPEGRVLFTLRGRPSDVDANTWQPWEIRLFTQALTNFIIKGLIHEEKLDSFDVPFYGASAEDIKSVVEKQGSFGIENLKTLTHNVAPEYEHDKRTRADKLSKIIRSYTESLVAHHFGSEVVEPLYDELASVIFEFLLGDGSPEHFSIAVLLIRNKEG